MHTRLSHSAGHPTGAAAGGSSAGRDASLHEAVGRDGQHHAEGCDGLCGSPVRLGEGGKVARRMRDLREEGLLRNSRLRLVAAPRMPPRNVRLRRRRALTTRCRPSPHGQVPNSPPLL